MNRVIFDSKPPAETRTLLFNFASRLAAGETVSSASTAATVYSGVDASPSSVISTTSVSSPVVTQLVSGGTSGVIYELTCSAVTSAGQTLKLSGYLAVVS